MEERAALLKPVNQSNKTPSIKSAQREKVYVLDTNVLIHDPNSLLNFEEHRVVIPMTVLEELDKLKSGKSHIATDCRMAIRLIDKAVSYTHLTLPTIYSV